MLCPHCKININTITVKDIDIDICPSCYGVWLDKDEILRLVEINRNELKLIDNEEEIDSEDKNKVEKLYENEIECPRCNKLMQKFPYAGSSDIIIDSCRNGCGIWLDKGEILRIAEYLSKQGKPLDEFERAKLKTQIASLLNTSEKKNFPWDFLNLQYNDANEKPEAKYLGIIFTIIQGLMYYLFRSGLLYSLFRKLK